MCICVCVKSVCVYARARIENDRYDYLVSRKHSIYIIAHQSQCVIIDRITQDTHASRFECEFPIDLDMGVYIYTHTKHAERERERERGEKRDDDQRSPASCFKREKDEE